MTDQQFLLSIGKKIKALRKAKLLTQQELADLSNCEKANLSRMESGKTNATVLTLKRVSDSLDVPINDLFSK
jgi:transcriptional regulator with XRE-family HTH domain